MLVFRKSLEALVPNLFKALCAFQKTSGGPEGVFIPGLAWLPGREEGREPDCWVYTSEFEFGTDRHAMVTLLLTEHAELAGRDAFRIQAQQAHGVYGYPAEEVLEALRAAQSKLELHFTVLWSEAVNLFDSLPDNPRHTKGGCFGKQGGECKVNLIHGGCGCAAWDQEQDCFWTLTSGVPVKPVEGEGGDGQVMASIMVPCDSLFRARALSILEAAARCPWLPEGVTAQAVLSQGKVIGGQASVPDPEPEEEGDEIQISPEDQRFLGVAFAGRCYPAYRKQDGQITLVRPGVTLGYEVAHPKPAGDWPWDSLPHYMEHREPSEDDLW